MARVYQCDQCKKIINEDLIRYSDPPWVHVQLDGALRLIDAREASFCSHRCALEYFEARAMIQKEYH